MKERDGIRNILATTSFLLPSMTASERRAAEYILENPEEVGKMSVKKLAGACGCGEATIDRMCKSIGTSGFAEYKTILRRQSQKKIEIEDTVNIPESGGMGQIVESVFKLNIQNLKKTLEIASVEEYQAACNAIVNAKKICFFAIGDAMFPCNYASLKFRRIGYECYADSDPDVQIVNACNMGKGDVAITISHSGKSRQVIEATKIAKEKGASVICITKAGKSDLTKCSDVVLYNETTDSTPDKEIIARRVAEQAMLDAIYMGVVKQLDAFEKMEEVSKNLKTNKVI